MHQLTALLTEIGCAGRGALGALCTYVPAHTYCMMAPQRATAECALHQLSALLVEIVCACCGAYLVWLGFCFFVVVFSVYVFVNFWVL